MFASRGIIEHIVRGAIGLGAILCAIAIAPAHPWLSLVAIPIAIIAFRGCPMCWTVGLVQTLSGKRKRAQSP